MRFKRMTEIYSRLVDHTITSTNEINDFSVGSAMRAIYESVAIELEQFYILTQENIQEAIERGVYSSFGFNRKQAVRAYGIVQITFHNPIQNDMVISRGSRFSSNQPSFPQVFETRESYLVPKGSLVIDVEAYCTSPGAYGNVPMGVINVMNSPIANVKTVRNIHAIQTGQDEEPLEELRARFRSYIKSLSKATTPAIEYGTREVPEVSGVHIDEKTGLITVYAHDRNGNLSEGLKKKIEDNLEHYRPSGIPLVVKPVIRKDVDINVTVTLTNRAAATTRFRNTIQDAITRYLNNLGTSQHLIMSDLTSVIKQLDRQLIYDIEFKDSEGNIYLEGHEIIKAGQVNVTLK